MREQGKTVYTAAVITVSDRGAKGEREDVSGPVVCEMLERAGYHVTGTRLVADEAEEIKKALIDATNTDTALIVTTGGTGFAPRDITPEATEAVCERMTPGIPEAMRAASMRITPHGCLSRGTAGIRDRSLIVNLPGSPKAAAENLEPVLEAIAHGLKMLRGGQADCGAQTGEDEL